MALQSEDNLLIPGDLRVPLSLQTTEFYIGDALALVFASVDAQAKSTKSGEITLVGVI